MPASRGLTSSRIWPFRASAHTVPLFRKGERIWTASISADVVVSPQFFA
nr:MAG TPA: hypothetical protein [Bacteriophage sp.]